MSISIITKQPEIISSIIFFVFDLFAISDAGIIESHTYGRYEYLSDVMEIPTVMNCKTSAMVTKYNPVEKAYSLVLRSDRIIIMAIIITPTTESIRAIAKEP